MEPQFQRKVFFKPSFIGTSGEFLGIPGFKDIFPPLHPTKGSPPMRFSYQEFRSVSLCILVCKCKCSYRLRIVQRMSHCSDKASWCRETKGKKKENEIRHVHTPSTLAPFSVTNCVLIQNFLTLRTEWAIYFLYGLLTELNAGCNVLPVSQRFLIIDADNTECMWNKLHER